MLRLGDPGFELDAQGQVIERAPEAFSTLLNAPIPPGTEHDKVITRIDTAVSKFRLRGSSIEDKRHAVRDLADVLELLRPDINQSMLSNDEADLFNLANNFSIRHNNRQQKATTTAWSGSGGPSTSTWRPFTPCCGCESDK